MKLINYIFTAGCLILTILFLLLGLWCCVDGGGIQATLMILGSSLICFANFCAGINNDKLL